MTTTKTYQTLLDQATTPLQTFILLAQLQMLRNLQSKRGATSAEALLVIFLVMAVLLSSFAAGAILAATLDTAPAILLTGLPN